MSQEEKILWYEASGEWDPTKRNIHGNHHSTFSVGIYPVVSKASGKGTKKLKAIVRVKGPTSHPELVHAEASRIIRKLRETGTYDGPKTVTVK